MVKRKREIKMVRETKSVINDKDGEIDGNREREGREKIKMVRETERARLRWRDRQK